MHRLLVECAEHGVLPDSLLRFGIRRLLRQRLNDERRPWAASRPLGGTSPTQPTVISELARQLSQGPMVVLPDQANRQHYEVPAAFYQQVLGRHLKYSCGYWPHAQTTLDEAEAAMLRLTTERAQIQDGMEILELGCGWGSLTRWLAREFPKSAITALSNSHGQRDFILEQCAAEGLQNVQVVTADIAAFAARQRFDRVISVEMFEHVRNHALLLERIANWLRPDGQLFVHFFCHRELCYLFETQGAGNWMGRHFFSGGMMPSFDWLDRFDRHLAITERWQVNGQHYQRTCEAWLDRLDQHYARLLPLFSHDPVQLQRWRMFFLACAELFGYAAGQEWFVGHYRLRPVVGAGR